MSSSLFRQPALKRAKLALKHPNRHSKRLKAAKSKPALKGSNWHSSEGPEELGLIQCQGMRWLVSGSMSEGVRCESEL